MEIEQLRNEINHLTERIGDLQNDLRQLKPENKEIFTLKELAGFLGKSPSTIYKLTCAGSIPHYKKGKHLYFDRAKILEWIHSGDHTPIGNRNGRG